MLKNIKERKTYNNLTLSKINIYDFNFTGVYIFKATTKDIYYVGSAVNIKNRFKKHLGDLKADIHHTSYLQRYYNKYGRDSIQLIETITSDIDSIGDIEQYFIDYYDSNYKVFNSDLIVKRCKTEGDVVKVIKRLKRDKMSNGYSRFDNIMKIKIMLTFENLSVDSIAKCLSVSRNLVVSIQTGSWALLNDNILEKYKSENKNIISELKEALANKKIIFKRDATVVNRTKREFICKKGEHFSDTLLVLHKMSCIYFDTNEKLFFNNRYLTKVQFNRILMKNYNIDRFKLTALRGLVTYQNLPNTIDELTALLPSQEIFNDLLKPFENFDKEVMYTDVKVNLDFDEAMTVKYFLSKGLDDIRLISTLLNTKYIDTYGVVNSHCIYIDELMLKDYYINNTNRLQELTELYQKNSVPDIERKYRLTADRINHINKFIELEKNCTDYPELNRLGYYKEERKNIKDTNYYKEYRHKL